MNFVFILSVFVVLALQACATGFQVSPDAAVPASSAASAPSEYAHLLVPQGFFKSAPGGPPAQVADLNLPQAGVGQAIVAPDNTVWLYASPTTQAHVKGSGIDFKTQVRVWETFLRKYHIPFKTVSSVETLETRTPGVLVLPSLVALTDREKQAIAKFRQLGGGVLASWLTGVRDDQGAWTGFAFMNEVLDVVVSGDTVAEEDVNYMMTHGDTPITYSLPAGQRVWTERVNGIYPLRLLGQQTAADIMDWSRHVPPDRSTGLIVFGERLQKSGLLSRTVVLGYPERLTMSADTKSTDAIAHHALLWLLRQPSAHLATWPWPFTGALSIVVDAPEVVDDADIKFAEWIEKSGSRATYYLVTAHLPKSINALQKLQSKGHQMAFMADHVDKFMGQPKDVQAKRLATMQMQMSQSSLRVRADAGFAAPFYSMDSTTISLIEQMGLDHYLALSDATDACIPVLSASASDASITAAPASVLLPRTLGDPEDLINEGEASDGLKLFLAQLDVSLATGGLSIVRFPNQSILVPDQLQPLFERIVQQSGNHWHALNSQVARWWRERSRVTVAMDVSTGVPRLQVTVTGDRPLGDASAVVDLPVAHDRLRLQADGHAHPLTAITVLDPWRVAVSLAGLPPGTYHWRMDFDHATWVPTR